ncbi:YcxB family protein [Mucilaginibacter psychrotolerans]|uniref:Uncharacterized protein n=1 Tax=Mucilaginibacter psychrotolerans TaxID=1524096 RepID=A0A4Y8SR93_9SPHI|nr:YcxB family protein [Mucilaginibacter psychrotolerans]TFF40894.1 hypothetical protein E2R66_01575 [Mucilaginibacter psychrotolerans]
MIVQTVLQEEDYLTYLLYSASKNKRSKANRRRSWLVLSFGFFALAFVLRYQNEFLAYWFLFCGIITLIFFPLYQRYSYKKHYQKFLMDKLGYRIDKESIIDFGSDIIETKDAGGESKIYTTELSEINEISTHYFVRLKSGDALVIPKAAVSSSFVNDLLTIFQNPNIHVTQELGWRWK